jgi:hypothetical protein
MSACNTAVTKLEFTKYNTLDSHHVLPPNAQELTVGSMLGSACLLPLTQLRQLTLLGHPDNVTRAAELRQLSILTSLTYIDLSYMGRPEDIAAAADGWSDLQLRRLDISPCWHAARLTRDTLLALSRLTVLWSLRVRRCVVDALQPAELGAVLRQLSSLESLSLDNVRLALPSQQQQVDSSDNDIDDVGGAAAAVSQIAPLLCSLAARIHNMHLRDIKISGLRIDRAAAAALASFVGVEELQLQRCQLDDCCLIDVALGLQYSLIDLCVADNRDVTDDCLPALRSCRRLTALNTSGTRVSREGKQRYLPQRLWGRW